MKNVKLVEDVVVDLLRTASTSLPDDVLEALKKAEREETSEVARTQLRTILMNVERADRLGLPMCQDTGLPVFFVSGRCIPHLEEAIRRGVSRATAEIPLRPNAVQPLNRSNPGDNLGKGMPFIHFEQTDADYTEITATPKGAGSENMSAIAMLTPSQGIRGVKKFVVETVVRAGSQPCPPTIVGVGIGGTADEALLIGRKSLLRRLDVPNPDPELAALEREFEEALNSLEIGPMGLGGRTTVLGVHVETCYTHTASLPVAVCFQCWAARKASARIYKDGKVEYSREGFK
ncbi:MAG TPA: fumarate hydratase [Methanomassiliicoccales archaeon]|nr:fumarate hydratase [Methanomassiliicoccales archaeon]